MQVTEIDFRSSPILSGRSRLRARAGGRRLDELKLRRDDPDRDDPQAERADSPGLRLPVQDPDETIRRTEETLARLDRQMKNLRALMGETFDGPGGPRAA